MLLLILTVILMLVLAVLMRRFARRIAPIHNSAKQNQPHKMVLLIRQDIEMTKVIELSTDRCREKWRHNAAMLPLQHIKQHFANASRISSKCGRARVSRKLLFVCETKQKCYRSATQHVLIR